MNARPDVKSFDEARPVSSETSSGARQEAPARPVEAPPAETAAPAIAASAEAAKVEAPVAIRPKKQRRPLRKLLIVALPLLLAAAGGYYWITGGRYINTEDAYVQQDRVTVMPQVSGQIANVSVAENQQVKAGDVLFTIDDAVYRNAIEQDQANLEAARLDVAKLKANYQQAVSQAQTASDALANAQTQNSRQRSLVGKGYVSQSSADATDLTFAQAKGALASAQSQVLGARAALAGNPDIPVDQHPEVLKALADLHAAQLDLAHTKIYAPEDGVVSQTARLQEGQYVTPAVSVLSLVETDNTWVEANYKETELTDMHVGQPVDVTLDTYPDHVFKATLGSIGAGTGSEFALLPAQNATGNWVKVVQRIPVRIHLQGKAGGPALRAGMSASVTVDTGHSRGVPEMLKPVVTALGLDIYLADEPAAAVAEAPAAIDAKPLASREDKPLASREELSAKVTSAEASTLSTKTDSGVDAPKLASARSGAIPVPSPAPVHGAARTNDGSATAPAATAAN